MLQELRRIKILVKTSALLLVKNYCTSFDDDKNNT